MKNLYKSVREKLLEIPELNWVDVDKGQLDFQGRPPVNFPCALINVQLPNTEDMSQDALVQDVDALVTVRIGFNFENDTHGALPTEPLVDAGFAYFDLVQAVYEKLQGHAVKGEFKKLSRSSVREERRSDMIKSVFQLFSTNYVDQSAKN